jgi:hypothetical protein
MFKKLFPLRVKILPPAVGPDTGNKEAKIGEDKKSKLVAEVADCPSGLVTVIA